jgi:hypothetical protein
MSWVQFLPQMDTFSSLIVQLGLCSHPEISVVNRWAGKSFFQSRPSKITPTRLCATEQVGRRASPNIRVCHRLTEVHYCNLLRSHTKKLLYLKLVFLRNIGYWTMQVMYCVSYEFRSFAPITKRTASSVQKVRQGQSGTYCTLHKLCTCFVPRLCMYVVCSKSLQFAQLCSDGVQPSVCSPFVVGSFVSFEAKSMWDH